jgi:DNA-binding transcriptional LysR family regulator
MRQAAERHPTVKTTLDVHTSPRIGELIGSGQFDLGLGHLSIDRPEIEVLGTWHVDCVCVMASNHPLAKRKVLRPEDMDGEALVSLSYQTDTAQWLGQVFQAAGVRPKILVEAQPSYVACLMAAEGLGIAIIDSLTAEFFKSDAISVVPFGPNIPFAFKLIRPAGTTTSSLATHFAEIALGIMNAHPLIK